MLDPKHDASWTETHRQSFSINYNYPVYFTRDLFDPANSCLQGALSAVEPDKRHRFALFVDDGVTLAAPNLLPRIARYVAAHASTHAARGRRRGGAGRRGGEEPARLCRAHAAGPVRAQHRPAVVRDRDRRRRRARRGRLRGGHLPSRRAPHPLPTTVLAQNDFGVGVKNGINAFGVKNLLGTFAPPFAVINDSAFLDMLPARDKRAGMAEAVKVALIRDADFFAWLEARGRRAGALRAARARHAGPALRRAAHAPDRARRRSVRDWAARGRSTSATGRRTSSRR